jgi:hypothetical protein
VVCHGRQTVAYPPAGVPVADGYPEECQPEEGYDDRVFDDVGGLAGLFASGGVSIADVGILAGWGDLG